MLVYVFRHGEAEAPQKGKKGGSDERHLTPDGRQWVATVVSVARKELGFDPELIVSSPLARARETAEIAHRTLGTKSDVVIEDCLLGDADVKDVYAVLRKRGPGSVALVTHLPLIDHLTADLLGGKSNIGLHSGSIAAIQCKTNPGRAKGSLRWLLPPRRYFDGTKWP